MQILDHELINECEWWHFVDSNDSATIFHTPYMHRVYEMPGVCKPFALFAVEQGKIYGMLNGYIQNVYPRIISRLAKRSVMMQSPLYENQVVLSALLKEYKKRYAFKSLFTEIRLHNDQSNSTETFRDAGFAFEEHLNIILDLRQDEAILWKQVHSKRRNEIRKAVKNHVQLVEVGIDRLMEAYSIIEDVYRRARLPIFGISFFEKALLLRKFGCGMEIYGAEWENKLIGTMITLQYKTLVYDFYAGSLQIHYDKNPNDYLPWHVFLECKNKGYATFDFGGAGKPNVPYGVRDYKVKFGGTMVNYGRYRFEANKTLFRLAARGFQIVQKAKRFM